MRVQAFAPDLAVEGFDEGIVRRLARPGEVKNDTVRVGSEIEVTGDKLAIMINADGLGVGEFSANPFQRYHRRDS